MTSLCDQPAVDLARDIAAGRLKAEALMAATLERIESLNPTYNAVVSLRDTEELIAEARRADRATDRGPLHGLPLAVKDLASVAGIRTSMGSPAWPSAPAPRSDLFVRRMQDAGAIVVGKTNTPEFGLGSHTYNPVHGRTGNAIDPGRTAGGSSGGAAVALAHGMVAIADGSDMMGSLRNPAGWNEVYGFRPSWGRVPSEPLGDLFAHQLSTNGPMGRCPGDLALVLDVISGRDLRQPLGHDADAVSHALDADVKGRRIAWLGDWDGAYAMEEGLLSCCQSMLGNFEALGCSIEAIPAPFSAEDLWESWTALRSWAVAASLGGLFRSQPESLKPEAVWEVSRGIAMTAADLQRASTLRSDWYRAALNLFETYDALVLPTAQCWPFPIEWNWPKVIAGQAMDTYHRWMEVVIPASLIGLPAAGVPAGRGGPDELPFGLQIIGKPRGDLGVLQLTEAWHRAKGH